MRMQPAMFHELLQRITPRIQKSTRYRKPLEPGLKLAITLRYLASGYSYKSLQYSFRVAHNTISLFIPEVCQALNDEYQGDVFAFPTNLGEWKKVIPKYCERWSFHYTCGALDRKHIAIGSPRHFGTLYYSYKGFFSIIILALVDADYKFIWADVGAQGSSSDVQIFNHGPLRLENGTLGLPDSEPLLHDDTPIPYFLVGDDALPLRTWMMNPFFHRAMTNEERMFTYCLSRARSVVENSCGILAHHWRCMLGTMQQKPHRVNMIVMAAMCLHIAHCTTCTLHNLKRLRLSGLQNSDFDKEDDPGNNIQGAWRNDRFLQDMDRVGRGNVANRESKRLREYLKQYYNSDVGRLSWQEHMK